MPLLSVVIPVFNEKNTIKEIIRRIQAVDIDKEIIIIDDSSSDGTREILKELKADNIRILYNDSNMGKGVSARKGIEVARGEFMIIQDADLEYNPEDYLVLARPLLDGRADFVFGDRFNSSCKCLFVHRLGNIFLTWFLNLLFGSHIRDYATCYKMARLDTFRRLDLRSSGFELEVEIICNALKLGLRIKEVPIGYSGRNYGEGKKIRFRDGIQAIFHMIKYRLRR